MSNNKIQKELVQSIISACENNSLDKVKELLPQISFNNEYHIEYESAKKIFQNTCLFGHLNIIEFLIETPYFLEKINTENIVNQTFDVLLEDILVNNELKLYPIISYILNESRLVHSKNFYTSLGWYLQNSARNDNLVLFKILLNADNYPEQAKVMLNNTKLFEEGCRNEDPQVLKYLYSTPQLFPLFDPEIGFKDACFYGNDELLKFIIFEYNIEKTQEIKRFIAQDNYENAEKMFQARELNKELNNELGSNQISSKKVKV